MKLQITYLHISRNLQITYLPAPQTFLGQGLRGSHGEVLTWSKPLTQFVLPWCLPREESPRGIQNFPHPHLPIQKASGRASPSHVPYSTGRDGG